MPKSNCEFRGSGSQYLTVFILHILLLGVLTLGIYSPWAWVRLLRLKASHTLINGKSVSFTGMGGQLFVLCLVSGLLTVVTLGIYWPWAACRISKWKAQHTLIDDQPSAFVGKGGELFLFSLIHFFILPALTFGLYSFYAMHRYYAWKEEHTRYGGARTSFGSGFWGVLRIYLIIIAILVVLPAIGMLVNLHELDLVAPLVCIVICPWLISMFFQWETQGLVVGDGEGIEHFPPVKTQALSVILFVILLWAAVIGGGMYVMDWLGSEVPGIEYIHRLFDLRQEETLPSGSVREQIKRPVPVRTPPVEPKTSPPAAVPGDAPAPGSIAPGAPSPATVAPAAPSPAPIHGKPSPAKEGPPLASLVPAWTSADTEKAISEKTLQKEMGELEAFIEKDSQNADGFYSRGRLYAISGDLDRADADLTRAIEIHQRNSNAFYNRGLIRARMGNFEAAVKDFDEAIGLGAAAADAYCNRGSAYFRMGKMDLAMKDYARALELKPNDPDLYYNRGLVHLSQGRQAEAKADFKKAVDLRDHPAPAATEKGAALTTPPTK